MATTRHGCASGRPVPRRSPAWTSRARPTFLYVIYCAILACFVGALAGIWWPQQVTQAAANLQQLLAAIPDDLWFLFGAGYLGHSASRSFDKWRGWER